MTRRSNSTLPVWIAWTELDEDAEVLMGLDHEFHIASPSERSRARNISGKAQSRRYFCGHVALRLALSQFAGLAPIDMEYLRASSGKPRLPGSDVEFSYAASSSLAVVALHRQTPVGIDIETKAPVHFRDTDLDQLATDLPLILSDKHHSSAPPPPGQAGWMLLEAFTKLRGERLAENLSRARPKRHVISKELHSADGTASAVRFALPGNQFGVCCAGCRSAEFKISRLDLVLG